MITKTREKIIELIEPYMHKTLSEGCIVLGNKCDENGELIDDTSIEYKTFLYEIEQGQANSKICKTMEGEYHIYKILGHYDITAVTRYIVSRKINAFVSANGNNILLQTGKESHTALSSYIIPNKPLHLFTENESQELLELLTKLI